MDERGYVAQALLDRLRDEAIAWRALGEAHGDPESGDEVEIAVPAAAAAATPRTVGRFCRDFDLQLVQLARVPRAGWRFVLAWRDEVGRPQFLTAAVVPASDELLGGAPDALFIHGLLGAIERQEIGEARGEWLSSLWSQYPRGAIERIGHYWPRRRDIRLLAQAAKHGDWQPVRRELPRLRRALPGRIAVFLRNLPRMPGPRIAIVGAGDPQLRSQIVRDLAPAFPGGAGSWLAFDPPHGRRFEETIEFHSVAQVERAILRSLECRLERRHPQALVGENPLAARLLQFSFLKRFIGPVLNCAIHCRVRSPILMPYPHGIVIDREAVIGSRVTVMHQVTVFGAVIEDNVVIGPGAKIIGAVRIGRGAVIGANAVVTRDVPSHSTVEVVEKRHGEHATVVNT